VLAAIRPNRSPRSHVAGATVLNRSGPRYSLDIDLFQDTAEELKKAVSADLASLEEQGFSMNIEKSDRDAWRVVATKGGEAVTIDWMLDESVRFFPAIPDDDLGYRLHEIDL
jgi:hypothetical protein